MKFVPFENYDALLKFGSDNRAKYVTADPFPNIYFENFFSEQTANDVLDEFPDLKKIADYQFDNKNEVKLATKGEYKLGEKARDFVHFLNSQPFLDFLSALTGIENLLPDPSLAGGGYHEIKPNGFLKIHSDFNKHPVYGLDRRINVLVYLNKDWKPEYGGNFELWDKDMTHCVKAIPPLFNTMALFSTTSKSYHGHPNPLTCPPDRSRKSIAMYYYTNGRPKEEVEEFLEDHSTIFKAREGIDDKQQTEDYLAYKLAKEKVNKRNTMMFNIAKSLTPPIIWNGLKKMTGRADQ
ncbi:MAG: 2OG-Fe(II) oxygenase [Bacteroidetes bacterium]|nr:2OG-Fe(II) oxygenase [Bacteroidota bacterium]